MAEIDRYQEHPGSEHVYLRLRLDRAEVMAMPQDGLKRLTDGILTLARQITEEGRSTVHPQQSSIYDDQVPRATGHDEP